MDYIIRTSIVWRTANQWNIGINFSARPGLYYTPVEYALNISDNVWFPLYGDYNSEQVTAYHSLDLTVNKIFPLNKGHLLAFSQLQICWINQIEIILCIVLTINLSLGGKNIRGDWCM